MGAPGRPVWIGPGAWVDCEPRAISANDAAQRDASTRRIIRKSASRIVQILSPSKNGRSRIRLRPSLRVGGPEHCSDQPTAGESPKDSPAAEAKRIAMEIVSAAAMIGFHCARYSDVISNREIGRWSFHYIAPMLLMEIGRPSSPRCVGHGWRVPGSRWPAALRSTIHMSNSYVRLSDAHPHGVADAGISGQQAHEVGEE